MEGTEYERTIRNPECANLSELRAGYTDVLEPGWVREYRISVRADIGSDATGSAIVRVMETRDGRAVLVTQPAKASYGGPPLPHIIASVVEAVAAKEFPNERLEAIHWIAHFNRQSYFEESNVIFEPEFCEVAILTEDDGSISDITVSRRIPPEMLARKLNVSLAILYHL